VEQRFIRDDIRARPFNGLAIPARAHEGDGVPQPAKAVIYDSFMKAERFRETA
jgi:hypothetical protein